MPRAGQEIADLLERLDHCFAHDLESQNLDFEEWDTRSLNQSLRTVMTSSVCMAHGGGGTVVFGVADKVVGRECAIVGVPPEVSVSRLRGTVYDSTDPKLTPVFQELHVPAGQRRREADDSSRPPAGQSPDSRPCGRGRSPNRRPRPRRSTRVRGSAGGRGVTEMYAPYISRYIFRRNVSRNVLQTHFRAKCLAFPAGNATGMRFHGVRAHFWKKNGTIQGSATRFRPVSASGLPEMSQEVPSRSPPDAFGESDRPELKRERGKDWGREPEEPRPREDAP